MCKQCFSLVPLYLSPHGEDILNVNRKDSAAGNDGCPFTPLPAASPPPEELLSGLLEVRDSNRTVAANGSGHCASQAQHPGATCSQAFAARCVQAANTAWLLEAHWPAALSLPDSMGH